MIYRLKQFNKKTRDLIIKNERILLLSLCSILLLIIMLSLIRGYGSTKPTETQAKEAIQKWFDKTFPELWFAAEFIYYLPQFYTS